MESRIQHVTKVSSPTLSSRFLSNIVSILTLQPFSGFSASFLDFYQFPHAASLICCKFQVFGIVPHYSRFSLTLWQSFSSTRWPSRPRDLRQISTSPRSSSKLPRASLQRDDTVGIVSAARVGLYGVLSHAIKETVSGSLLLLNHCEHLPFQTTHSFLPLLLPAPSSVTLNVKFVPSSAALTSVSPVSCKFYKYATPPRSTSKPTHTSVLDIIIACNRPIIKYTLVRHSLVVRSTLKIDSHKRVDLSLLRAFALTLLVFFTEASIPFGFSVFQAQNKHNFKRHFHCVPTLFLAVTWRKSDEDENRTVEIGDPSQRHGKIIHKTQAPLTLLH